MAIDPELIYIEILETVLMATLDPDLWKSALQKLAFLTGSALMELFNVKPAENAVAELLVRGMTPDECALHLGVSIATIGTHLSALYQKTHTRHQAELLLILRVIDGEWFRSVRNDGRAGKRSAPLSAARRRIRQSSSPPRRGDRRRERACGSASPSRSYCRRRRRQI